MACRLACFACFVFPAAAEPQLTLNPVKMPQGGGSLVCKNVAYGPRQPGNGAAHPDVAQTYDLYLPAEIGKIPENAPFFLYIHGGAWIGGNKNWPIECRSVVKFTDAGKMPFPSLPSDSP